MKKVAYLWLAGLLVLPAGSLFGGDIMIRLGDSSGLHSISRFRHFCFSRPIFYPRYFYYGYMPFYSYMGYYPSRSYSSSSYYGGRTIRLGEGHESFWQRHGGFEPAGFGVGRTEELGPLPESLAAVDREAPLQIGDLAKRIRDLGLEINSISASGDTAIYHLADGRTVRTEQGIVLEISGK